MNRRYLIKLILAGLVILLGACERPADTAGNAMNVDAKRAERPAHAVEVVQVSQQATRLKRTLTGTLEAPRTVHIHSERAGRILDLPFFEGDRVSKGAPLAHLDDALIRAELEMAVATRKQTEVNFKRLQNLAPRKLATEDELARASTAVELARAAESLQRTQLSRTIIKAPFTGVISERLKEPSDVVPLNEHILTLFDPELITAAVWVPEQLHSQLALGDAVQVSIDSLGDQTFSGEILRIHPMVNAETRKGAVEIQLKPVPPGARPGQLCRVTLETTAMPRRTIPLPALQYDSQGAFVYRVETPDAKTTKARRVAVHIGLQFGERVEILDGLKDGDHIVSKGFLGLKFGKTIRVIASQDQQIVSRPATPVSKRE